MIILYLEGEWRKIHQRLTVVSQWTPLYQQKKANQDGYNTIAKGCTTKSKVGMIIFCSAMFLSKK